MAYNYLQDMPKQGSMDAAIQGYEIGQKYRQNKIADNDSKALADILRGDTNAITRLQSPELIQKAQNHLRELEQRKALQGFYTPATKDQYQANITQNPIAAIMDGNKKPSNLVQAQQPSFQESQAPTMLDMLQTGKIANGTPASYDVEGAGNYLLGQGDFDQLGKLTDYRKAIAKDNNDYFGGLTEGVDPVTQKPILLAMTKKGAVPSGYAPRPKETTQLEKWRQDFDERKFKADQDKSAKELAQGQQKIEIERKKVGTESSDNAIDPNAPWAKVANPKEREKLKATVAIKDNARLDELRDAVTRSRANLRDMQRFSELNQRTGTGGINEKYNPVTFNADKQEMEAIEARLTPQMRPIGSGATSDFEGKMYGRGIPQVSKSGTANREIRLTAERAMKLGEAELAFKEQFLQQNGYLPKDSQTNEFLRQFESTGKINHGDTLSQLPATAPKGAVAKNATTGKPEYIFNGSKWIPVGGAK